MNCPHRAHARPARPHAARPVTRRASRGLRPTRHALPRRHDNPGRGAGIGCRHSHGLDIVWSARHGITSEETTDSPELHPVLEPVLDPAPTPHQGTATDAQSLTTPAKDTEPGVAVRLALLWATLALGTILLLGIIFALATALGLNPIIATACLSACALGAACNTCQDAACNTNQHS
ncbi:Uncharacterised protein [Dermatophilus congolensis]|uniref:Uncharacterized protein n=1 Tax=Dermatophilus congolensis TaxID=1863 RepID=A0AA46BPP1_9MICO|nr:hypothetical protein [Dermatophilus congolensis]STD13815.1 Uncharacterised protein [Dermatophilus congolensis]